MQRRACTVPCNLTTERYGRSLVRMAMADQIVSSTRLSRFWSIATGVEVSVPTTLLQKAGLVVRMRCIGLHCPKTTKVSHCNGHVNFVTGVMSGKIQVFMGSNSSEVQVFCTLKLLEQVIPERLSTVSSYSEIFISHS